MSVAVFVIAQIILRLTFPVSIALLLGLAALCGRRKPRLSLTLAALSMAWLFVTALPVTGLLLVRPIENAAGPYADPAALFRSGVKYVVVLSGGFREGQLTAADRAGCSMLRLIEGIRLWRGIAGAELVVTGGLIPGLSEETTIAEALAEAAEDLGVPRDAVVLERGSWSTEDQARAIGRIVGNEPFALVTSAYHLPRSKMLCEFEGLKPISAPADFLAKKINLGYAAWIPQAAGLEFTEIAFKERFLLYVQWVKARISRALR